MKLLPVMAAAVIFIAGYLRRMRIPGERPA